MYEVLKVVVILVTAFMAWVACAMAVKKGRTVVEATLICKKICKEIWLTLIATETPPQPEFPVWVGAYENRFNLQLVDKSFEKIAENFPVFYCVKSVVSPSRIAYRFSIQRTADSPDDADLELLIQKQAEEALAKHMRTYDCYISADLLTAVELRQECVLVTFARNQSGIDEIEKFKTRIRKKRFEPMNNNHESHGFAEKWSVSGEEQ